MGSLFDGIGVFPLAASHCGIKPIWASEIEKGPISITKKHFPQMAHLGDITKLHGGEIPPTDIITFGSPCQSLSVAGYREGLVGIKSNLYYEAIRIIEEMRLATNGIYPTIAVWENVMGAFSSNDRMDFRAVLQSFTDTEIPMPPSGRWASVGMVRGGTVDLCWRVMDARYWGEPPPPQRRKRIFLISDFRGQRAREILFKPRNLLPYFAVCREGENTTATANRISIAKTGGSIPIIHPFRKRAMRICSKQGNKAGFIRSFGRANDPFPTLLASEPENMFAFWYEGKEKDGILRLLTPLECERLMGLPENWTAYGDKGQPISAGIRYKSIGNSIALPCAIYIMAGIVEELKGG